MSLNAQLFLMLVEQCLSLTYSQTLSRSSTSKAKSSFGRKALLPPPPALFAQGPFTCDPDGDPETNDRYKKLSTAQRDIADVIIAIINHCITTGYVLDRWKTIVNTMILHPLILSTNSSLAA